MNAQEANARAMELFDQLGSLPIGATKKEADLIRKQMKALETESRKAGLVKGVDGWKDSDG